MTVQEVGQIRVLLIDDHQMLTEALAVRLSTAPDMCVVGQCANDGADPAGLAAQLRPDVITVELAPDCDAAAVFVQLRTAWPPARVVVLTASRDPQAALKAARAGADGWVFKESSVDSLVEVLRSVCRGHAHFPPEHLGLVLRELQEDVRRVGTHSGPLDALTSRERGVLLGWIEGRTSAEIADELDVSTHTVRTHANNILAKLGVHHRLEAVRAARAAGIRPNIHRADFSSMALGSR